MVCFVIVTWRTYGISVRIRPTPRSYHSASLEPASPRRTIVLFRAARLGSQVSQRVSLSDYFPRRDCSEHLERPAVPLSAGVSLSVAAMTRICTAIVAKSTSLPGAEPFLLHLLSAGLLEIVRTPCGSPRSPVYSGMGGSASMPHSTAAFSAVSKSSLPFLAMPIHILISFSRFRMRPHTG